MEQCKITLEQLEQLMQTITEDILIKNDCILKLTKILNDGTKHNKQILIADSSNTVKLTPYKDLESKELFGIIINMSIDNINKLILANRKKLKNLMNEYQDF